MKPYQAFVALGLLLWLLMMVSLLYHVSVIENKHYLQTYHRGIESMLLRRPMIADDGEDNKELGDSNIADHATEISEAGKRDGSSLLDEYFKQPLFPLLNPHHLTFKLETKQDSIGIGSRSRFEKMFKAIEFEIEEGNSSIIEVLNKYDEIKPFLSFYEIKLSRQPSAKEIPVRISMVPSKPDAVKLLPDKLVFDEHDWNTTKNIQVLFYPDLQMSEIIEVLEVHHRVSLSSSDIVTETEVLNVIVYKIVERIITLPPEEKKKIVIDEKLLNFNILGNMQDFIYPPDLPVKSCQGTIVDRHSKHYRLGPKSWLSSGNSTQYLDCYGQSQPNPGMFCIGNGFMIDSDYFESEMGGEDVLSVMGRPEEKEFPNILVGAFRFTRKFSLIEEKVYEPNSGPSVDGNPNLNSNLNSNSNVEANLNHDAHSNFKPKPEPKIIRVPERCIINYVNPNDKTESDISHTTSQDFALQLNSLHFMKDVLSSICGTSMWRESFDSFLKISRSNRSPHQLAQEMQNIDIKQKEFEKFYEEEKDARDICSPGYSGNRLDWQDTITVFVTRFEYVNLYHTVTEIFSAYTSLLGAEKKLNRAFIKERKFRIVFLDSHAQGELDSLWSMFFKVPVYRIGQIIVKHNFICLGETVFVESGYSADLSLNTQTLRLESHVCTMAEVKQFSDHFIETEGLSEVVPIKNNVVFILRDSPKLPPHPRVPLNEEVRSANLERTIFKEDIIFPPVAKILKDVYGITINFHRFSQVSFREQMRIVREAEVVISLHGAALSHLLWAPDTFFVELVPPGFEPRTHFTKFAIRRGARFARIVSDQNTYKKYDSGPLEPLGMVAFLRSEMKNAFSSTEPRVFLGGAPSFVIGPDMLEALVYWTIMPIEYKLNKIRGGAIHWNNLMSIRALENEKKPKTEPQQTPVIVENNVQTSQSRSEDTNAPIKQLVPPRNQRVDDNRLPSLFERLSHRQLCEYILANPTQIIRAKEGAHKLCIIVPFRDGCGKNDQGAGRENNLKEFILHMNKHFRATHHDDFDWRIIIVEQSKRGLFNKGALFNTGIIYGFDCDYFVFHDVDQVPESTENDYSYPKQTEHPIHMCTASSQFNYKPAYHTMVGGALMMTREQAFKVNGYTNEMFSWGREDDEMYERITRAIGGLDRLSSSVGRYKALDHPRVMGLDLTDQFKKNDDVVARFRRNDPQVKDHYKSDGLTTISTTVQVKLKNMQFDGTRVSKILVDVLDKSRQPFPPCDS